MAKTVLQGTPRAADHHDVPSSWMKGETHGVVGWQALARIPRASSSASLVEYALLVAPIAVACIVAVTLVGGSATTKFSSVGSALQ